MRIEQVLVGPMAVFCYLVVCQETGECILIDPAGDEDRILHILVSKKWHPLNLINTHGHPDHTCGNQRIVQGTGVKIVMHEEDARLFDTPMGRSMAIQMGFPASPPVDRKVKDGEIITFGKEAFAGDSYSGTYPRRDLPLCPE
jgi:hydroxyacylglutathione hydrolase